jgi:hypothetical protein
MEETFGMLVVLGTMGLLVWAGHSCGTSLEEATARHCHRQFARATTTTDSLNAVVENSGCKVYLTAARGDSL